MAGIPIRRQIKLVNLAIGVLMIVVGGMDFLFGEGGLISIRNITPLYLILFGCMTIAGDFELSIVLKWCGFLGHYTLRGLFTFYCGLNLLISRTSLTKLLQPIAVIGGWVTIGFALVMLFLGFFMKDSLYAKEFERYLHDKNPVDGLEKQGQESSQGSEDRGGDEIEVDTQSDDMKEDLDVEVGLE